MAHELDHSDYLHFYAILNHPVIGLQIQFIPHVSRFFNQGVHKAGWNKFCASCLERLRKKLIIGSDGQRKIFF